MFMKGESAMWRCSDCLEEFIILDAEYSAACCPYCGSNNVTYIEDDVSAGDKDDLIDWLCEYDEFY